MPETSLDILPSAPYTALVHLYWGDSNVARYTRWSEDLTVGKYTYTSEPKMLVKFDKPITIGTADSPVSLRIPLSRTPFDTLSELTAHARVNAIVQEVMPGLPDTAFTRFKGFVGQVKANTRGHQQFAECKLWGIKHALGKIQLGLPATATCRHALGFGDCGFDLEIASLSGTVSNIGSGAINRLQVTFSGSPTVTNDRFAHGYLEYDGLRIAIRRAYEDGSNPDPVHTFDLRQIPPAEWDGVSVTVAPGCNKTLAACRDSFRNLEEFFLAPGRAMPAYNPVFEDSPGT